MENYVERSLNIVHLLHAGLGASLRLKGRAKPIRSSLEQALVFWPNDVTTICTLHLPRSVNEGHGDICRLYAWMEWDD